MALVPISVLLESARCLNNSEIVSGAGDKL
jgi:hypothetical protein